MSRPPVSDEVRELVLALRATGLSATEVGIKAGCSRGTVSGIWWRERASAPQQAPARKKLRVSDEQLKALTQAGLTAPQMAARLGYDRSAISRRLRRLGLSQPRGRGRPRKEASTEQTAPAAPPSWQTRFKNPEDRRAGR